MFLFGRALLGLVVAIGTTVMLVAAPAGAATAASINPTAGPPGTVITATVPNCDGGTPGATLKDTQNVVVATGTVSGSDVKITVPSGAALGIDTVHASCVVNNSTETFAPVSFTVTEAKNTGLVSTPIAGAVLVTSAPGTTLSDLRNNGPVPAGGPFGWSFPAGMTGFKVSGVPSGATTDVTFSPLEVTTALFEINGSTFTKVGEIFCDHLDGCSGLTLTLTDGGAGDQDGTANGVIVGQGALAWSYLGKVSTPGGTVTIQSPSGTVLGVTPVQTSMPVPAGGPAGVTFPFDWINFSVEIVPKGATITVSLGLPSPVTDFYQIGCAQKVACRTFTFTKFGGAEVSCETKDSVRPCTLTLTLTDGGAGDQDGSPQANGAIDVSGAPATVSGSAPTTVATAPAQLPRTGSTSGGLAALGGAVIVAGAAALAASRRRIRGTCR